VVLAGTHLPAGVAGCFELIGSGLPAWLCLRWVSYWQLIRFVFRPESLRDHLLESLSNPRFCSCSCNSCTSLAPSRVRRWYVAAFPWLPWSYSSHRDIKRLSLKQRPCF
jgi:hypothetical protein